LIRIVAVLATVMIVYPFLPGSGSEVFRGFSLFAGALFTLGASSSVTNIIAGVILTYTRSFRVGDRIQLGGAFGDVLAKGLFVTRIRTPLNEEVTIPNSVAMGGRVVNYSAAQATSGLVLTVRAGIGYDVDWRRVHELMKKAAEETDNVLGDPEPFVLQESLGDYAVVYELRAHTDDPMANIQTQSDLRRNVLDAFNRAGVEIMTPAVNAVRNSVEPTIPAEYVDETTPSALRMLGLEA
jgi:small-conductance mechanosensitive channel